MTPAIQMLKSSNVSFTTLSYEHDVNNTNYGLEAVEKLNLNSAQVFKTLVLETSEQQLIVAVTPVTQQVNLKQLAKLCVVKKVMLAEPQKVQASTGYILGGVSPLGQKKRLTTSIDITAKALTTIYVSGGKRGVELALSPSALAQLTQARFVDIAG